MIQIQSILIFPQNNGHTERLGYYNTRPGGWVQGKIVNASEYSLGIGYHLISEPMKAGCYS